MLGLLRSKEFWRALAPLQSEVATAQKTPEHPVETGLLDSTTEESLEGYSILH